MDEAIPPITQHPSPDTQGLHFVSVAINRPFGEALTYSCGPELFADLEVGALVEVPLGPRHEVGCVVDLHAPADLLEGEFAVRAAIRRVSPGYRLSPELIALAEWMAEYYLCTLGEALAAMSAVGFSDIGLGIRDDFAASPGWRSLSLTKRQQEIMAALQGMSAPLPELARAAGATAPTLKKLAAAGALCAAAGSLPPGPPLPAPDTPPPLMREQQQAFDAIEAVRSAGEFGVFLLHGVTGSGKTEVYLRLIGRALAEGKSALCLVPEIALTPQTVDRFARRFQQEVGVFHSQLSKREKLVLYEKMRRGTIRLVIGARSAAFADLPRLGIVIIDEEHETSYKQGETPRYHARDLSILRASRLRIPVVLGSATPSMESYENAQRGKFRLLRLSERPAGLAMPEVRLVPMGKAAADSPADGLQLLSPELKAAIDARLERREQSILFLNRRGFSAFIFCPSCNWVARCDDDDIVLTVHRKGPRAPRTEPGELDLFTAPLKPEESYAKCHFCARTYAFPKACPQCGEDGLVPVGTGTQRVEETLKQTWPQANILRLDQDAVSGRRAFIAAWQKMVSGEAEIILGTQMIAKGLHLERVTLVGVILADIGLYIPDFRAEERTFSLLMQVAGRAGRENPGEVLVQTYLPHHSAIQFAARHDYEGFYAAELKRRQKLRFPPAERLAAVTVSDEKPDRAQSAARLLGGILRRLSHREECRGVAVLGPQPAPIERLAGRFRHRLLLRTPNQRPANRLLRLALSDPEWRPASGTRVAVDVDPMDLM